MCPEIDVVVPTRDRAALLVSCLDSLLGQTSGPFRVTVVDDASRVPVTTALPERLLSRPELRIIRQERSIGPGGCRNRGVAAGDAPYVVFVDDDCRAGPDLLARHGAVLASSARVVSIGALHPPPAIRLPPWNRWEADRLAREQARVVRGEVAAGWSHFYTANAAVRREDFVSVGGFDERLARQEDIELGARLDRLGCRFVFEPGAVVWHDSRRSLDEWLPRPAMTARNDVLMDRLNPGSGRLRAVREALGQRHWLLRAARRSLGSGPTRRPSVRLAVNLGRALHALHADRLAMPAFSVVWDLEYTRALAEATSEVPGPG